MILPNRHVPPIEKEVANAYIELTDETIKRMFPNPADFENLPLSSVVWRKLKL